MDDRRDGDGLTIEYYWRLMAVYCACDAMVARDRVEYIARHLMTEVPRVTQTKRELTAIIHVTVPTEEIRNVMGPTLDELRSTIATQGIASAGPWFTHHLRRPSDTFDFEVSIPVTTAVAPAGRVQPSEWPAMTVARTVYHGDYEGLGDAWSEFLDWIEANGHTSTEDLWEVYTVGPDDNPNPGAWRTELTQPLT